MLYLNITGAMALHTGTVYFCMVFHGKYAIVS